MPWIIGFRATMSKMSTDSSDYHYDTTSFNKASQNVTIFFFLSSAENTKISHF